MKILTILFMIAGLIQAVIIMHVSFILGLVLCVFLGYYLDDLDKILKR